MLLYLSKLPLKLGDVDNNNRIDRIDEDIVVGCFSELAPPKNCDPTKKLASDLNADGKVNALDYSLMVRSRLIYLGD